MGWTSSDQPGSSPGAEQCHAQHVTDRPQRDKVLLHGQCKTNCTCQQTENQVQRFTPGHQNNLHSCHYNKWYHGLANLVSSTLYQCKVGASYVYPNVRFSMMCSAHLQQHSEGKSFGLAVVLCRHDEPGAATSTSNRSTLCIKVGGSIHPRMVPSGTIAIRLVSHDFEADSQHGEIGSLVKIEKGFRGRNFEKQFACRFKDDPVNDGVFGKVLVEHVQDSGLTHTLFEFNLTKGRQELPPKNNAESTKECERWSQIAVRELAAMLHVTEDDQWKQLAKCLGFTDHEIRTILGLAKDPFQKLLASYQSRGGSPEEFVQALYEASNTKRPLFYSDGSPVKGFSPQSVSIHSSWSTLASYTTREAEDEDYTQIPLATFPLQVLPGQTICTSLPLTPPHTPRKRKLSTSADSGTPKKGRRLFFDDTSPGCGTPTSPSVFVFPDVVAQSDPEDQTHRECADELPSSVLWQVSAHIHHKWKSLGRTLDVPETELMCIEHANKDLRECAYQMLLKWQSIFPERFCYGVLYAGLCDCGIKNMALKFCTKH